MALDIDLTPSIRSERFLFPSGRVVGVAISDDQIINGGFETGDTTGWTVTDGSIVALQATRMRGLWSCRFTKDVAAGTAARMNATWRPSRGLFIPNLREVVGPFDHVKTLVAPTDTKIAVDNIDRWPDSGTGSFEHALRNSNGINQPIEEFSWNGKTVDSLDNVQRNLRNENRTEDHHVGSILVGTAYLRRLVCQAWVLGATAQNLKVRIDLQPQYDTGATYAFSGNAQIGPVYTLAAQNQWYLIETVFDYIGTNINNPAGAEPDQIQIRLWQDQDNAINDIVWVDDVRMFHALELEPRDTNPVDTLVDVGEVFERTPAGTIRSARVTPRIRRSVLTWGRENTLTNAGRDALMLWHRAMCYPEGAASRSFDYQAHARESTPLNHDEVVWADPRPQPVESGHLPEWGLAIPLEHIVHDTAAGVARGFK